MEPKQRQPVIVKWKRAKGRKRTFVRFILDHMSDVEEVVRKGRAIGYKVWVQNRGGSVMEFDPVS